MEFVAEAKIRKVRVLSLPIREKAKNHGLNDEDLVIVKTVLEKVEGDPVGYLLERVEQ